MKTTAHVIGVILLLAIAIWFQREDQKRMREQILRDVCQGQCQHGDSYCHKRCDKMGYCPQESK